MSSVFLSPAVLCGKSFKPQRNTQVLCREFKENIFKWFDLVNKIDLIGGSSFVGMTMICYYEFFFVSSVFLSPAVLCGKSFLIAEKYRSFAQRTQGKYIQMVCFSKQD